MAGPSAALGGGEGTRFSPRSVSKWYYILRSDVTGATPTRTEIETNGTDLTPAVASVSGFTESANFTETPDLASHQTGKILDGITREDGSISFYGARDGVDAKAFFTIGELGYVMHFPYGDDDGAGSLTYDLFATEVGSVSSGTATTGAKMVDVTFGLNAKTDDVAIPTAP